MKITSIMGNGTIALLGILLGMMLTLQLIRYDILPGGGFMRTQSDVLENGVNSHSNPTLDPRRDTEGFTATFKNKNPGATVIDSPRIKVGPIASTTKTTTASGLHGPSDSDSTTLVEGMIGFNSNQQQYQQQHQQHQKKQHNTNINNFKIKKDHDAAGGCKYDFKVYVYELPAHLASVRYAEEARINRNLHVCQKCILEQFSLEFVVTDFLSKFCGRTHDPEEADFFYLPIIRDAEYRVTLDPNNKEVKGNRRAPSQTEEALLQIMGDFKPQKKGGVGDHAHSDSTLWRSYFNVTDKWWNRRQGMDHIIVMAAPVTNLRHEGSMRGFFHYMMHLHTPIFLNVEYSRSFISEYPICATRKNIVMPYPTTDPDLFNGKLHSDPVDRHSLIYYAGGMHGECVGIRRAIRSVMTNGTKIRGSHITPRYNSNMKEREHGMRSATFCPIPIGDSPSSKRMYDVIHFGCIPVVLSDELVYAYSNFSGGPLDDVQYTIRLPQSIIQFPTEYLLKKFGSSKARKLFGHLPDGTSLWSMLEESATLPAYEEGIYINPLVHILRMVSQKNLKILKDNIARVERYYRYYDLDKSMKVIPTAAKKLPDGGAIEMFARMLSKRKREGIEVIGKACQEERFRANPRHKYVGNYPCDRDNANSLMGAMNRRRL